METALVWMILAWGHPALLGTRQPAEVVAFEENYFATEKECWENVRKIVALGTVRLTCTMTMTTRSTLDKMTERQMKTLRDLDNAMKQPGAVKP